MVRRLVAGSFVFAFLVTSPGSNGGPGLAAVRTTKVAASYVTTGASLPGAAALVIQGMMLVLRAAP